LVAVLEVYSVLLIPPVLLGDFYGSLNNILNVMGKGKKGKVFPYSLPSVGPGADPGVQAVSPQVT